MKLQSITKHLIPNSLAERFQLSKNQQGIEGYSFKATSALEIKKDIQDKYQHDSELLDLFAEHQGPVVHKWHHYIPLYERYLSSFRGQKVRFLEIGVSQGGSLEMWRKYFGEDAVIFGIDINPHCAKLNDAAGQVRIGSQDDPDFLASVIKEMGGVDIVLDDGSHHMDHLPVTLNYLFPCLSNGGIYMIEDLHTAYWRLFGGGYQSQKNFFRFTMDIIDDMHHWYHGRKLKQATVSNDCSGVHIHDSLLVLEKNEVFQPVHSRVGSIQR
jgi:hypothetical protein